MAALAAGPVNLIPRPGWQSMTVVELSSLINKMIGFRILNFWTDLIFDFFIRCVAANRDVGLQEVVSDERR